TWSNLFFFFSAGKSIISTLKSLKTNVNEESDSSSYPEDFLYRRERLPSIVVEPTEHSEPESGELRWPPRCLMSNSVEEEEEDSSADHTEGSMDGEQLEDVGIEEG
uniref:LBH domain-containing protein n=1 Tax=Dicentrarchus labrax TaxID=13489 RepID=A0A8P4KGS6_DICLA